MAVRPYPLAPLAAALQLPLEDTAGLAAAVRVDRRWVKRARHTGLTERQADMWATRAGLHPRNVWPLWGELYGAAAVNAHKTVCPQGHPYDALDSRGWRRCKACRRRSSNRATTQVADLAEQGDQAS